MKIVEQLPGTYADQQSLTRTANNHLDMITMGNQARQQGGTEVRANAEMKKQQAELEHIIGGLRSDHGVEHMQQVDPKSEQMRRELEGHSGAAYDLHFRQMTSQHHQEGIRMGEPHLAQLSEPPQVMVPRMRAEHAAEVEVEEQEQEQEQNIKMGM